MKKELIEKKIKKCERNLQKYKDALKKAELTPIGFIYKGKK